MANPAPPPPSLADESERRKLRLLALRRRRAGEPAADGDDAPAPAELPRNFDPETRTLRKRTGDEDDTVEAAVAGVAASAIAEDRERQAQDLDLLNIAPKRANWDLRREMDKKLARLERRTQEAIHTLIRQRLQAQKGESDDIVGAMRAQAAGDAGEDEDDD